MPGEAQRRADRYKMPDDGSAFNAQHVFGASPSKQSQQSRQRIRQKVGDFLIPGNVGSWEESARPSQPDFVRLVGIFFLRLPRDGLRPIANVSARVRRFLTRRHKVQSRGTERFGDERVFGELRVIRLAPPPDCVSLR